MLFINVSASGKRKEIFTDLATQADFQDVSIDSTIVKVHQDAGTKKKS